MAFFQKIIAFFTALFALIFHTGTPVKTADITVMTYNVSFSDLTETRLDALLQQIKAVEPDSYGAQEVKDKSKAYFDSQLSEYESYAVSDEDTGNITYDVLYWLKAKYTKTEQGYIFLSKTPDVVSKSWDSKHRRMLQWVKLKNKKTGAEYVHANCHLDNVGYTARYESMKLIEQYLSSFDCPVIVSGDFNCRYTGDEIKLLESMGWINTMKMSGIERSTDTFHGYNDSDLNHSPIDHIFVKNFDSASDWIIHKEKYNGIYPSDHFALSVNLSFSYKK